MQWYVRVKSGGIERYKGRTKQYGKGVKKGIIIYLPQQSKFRRASSSTYSKNITLFYEVLKKKATTNTPGISLRVCFQCTERNVLLLLGKGFGSSHVGCVRQRHLLKCRRCRRSPAQDRHVLILYTTQMRKREQTNQAIDIVWKVYYKSSRISTSPLLEELHNESNAAGLVFGAESSVNLQKKVSVESSHLE